MSAHSETCAEPIAGETTVHEGRQERHSQECGLPAQDWCASCLYYVCSDHVYSRHELHSRSTAPVHRPKVPEYDVQEQGDRRHGGERREDR